MRNRWNEGCTSCPATSKGCAKVLSPEIVSLPFSLSNVVPLLVERMHHRQVDTAHSIRSGGHPVPQYLNDL